MIEPSSTDPPVMTSTSLQGEAILVVWGTVSNNNVDEEDLNDWWTNEHLPERLAIPGFLRARRYYAETQNRTSRYLTWYETATMGTLMSHQYLERLNDPTTRTSHHLPTLASMSRSACRVLHTVARPEFGVSGIGAAGATIAHIVFDPPPTKEAREETRNWITENLSPGAQLDHPSVLAFHLLEHDGTATRFGSSSQSYDGVPLDDPLERWMIIIEFAEPIWAPFAQHPRVVQTVVDRLQHDGRLSHVDWQIYQLICTARQGNA